MWYTYKFILSALFFLNTANAVITQFEDSYSFKNNIYGEYEVINMPSLDIEALIIEDENNLRNGLVPIRYAHEFSVDIDTDSFGTWEDTEDGGKLWRLGIFSPNAHGIKVNFDQFWVPKGAELYVYSRNKDMTIGPYTSDQNIPIDSFQIPLVASDLVVIEYYQPQSNQVAPQLHINSVFHAYKDVHNFSGSRETRSCGDNVACNSANAYEDQVNSVIFLDMGGYICSAALINNVEQDLTPYVLTAYHCVEGQANIGQYNNFTFYFNHQGSSCSSSSGYYGNSITGSYLRSWGSMSTSDFALLEMTDNPPTWWDAFYAGWDRSSSSPQVTAGIHHPGGEPKKINLDYNDTAYTCGWYGSSTHWCLTWDSGGTAGGSSGSPIFDDQKRIVGQLSGGTGGDCGNGTDYYGKMSTSWSNSNSSSGNLRAWLDPNNTGTFSIDGTYTAGESDYITVTSPNGNESFEVGETYNISWDSNSSSNVSIKLYSNGSLYSTISANTYNDGLFSWEVPSSVSSGYNYKIKVTSNSNSSVYDYSDSSFAILSPSVSLVLGDIDVNNGIIDIDMVNQSPVSGFQFVLSDSPNYITISGAGNGLSESYGFNASTSASGTVIAFSLSGSDIPPSNSTLIELYFDVNNPGMTTNLCIEDVILSDPDGSELLAEIGGCESVALNAVTVGDINFDSSIDVLDVIIQVNAILEGENTTLSSSQLIAADSNSDGIINIMDVVILVNQILEN